MFILYTDPDTGRSGGYYGSLYEPEDLGSRGGPGSNGELGGRGGGTMRIIVVGVFTMDGSLIVDGLPGTSNSGGGSGGSLWVTADDLRGHGTMSAIGGTGGSSAGGGAGGRIAIHTSEANEYRGALLAYGRGGSTGGDVGGPGTVFVEDTVVRDQEYSSRYCDT